MAQMSFRFMSWNLKFFGNYNYRTTREWMAQSIINAQADVVVILEVFNPRGSGSIGQYLTSSGVENAVKKLCVAVNEKDSASNWTFQISGGNAGASRRKKNGSKRDAYAFLWKTTPAKLDNTTYQRPLKISLVKPLSPDKGRDIKILRRDISDAELGFSGHRRPGGGIFRFEFGLRKGEKKDVLLCGYHAPAPPPATKEDDIFKAIQYSIFAAQGEQHRIAEAPTYTDLSGYLIGADMNLNYPSYNPKSWDEVFKITTGIKQNGGSSLFDDPENINFAARPTIYTVNDYDNFLFDGLKMVAAETKVYNPIDQEVERLKKETKALEELDEDDLRKEIYLKYYPTKAVKDAREDGGKKPPRKKGKTKSIDDKTSCVSDHFPIIGQFVFS